MFQNHFKFSVDFHLRINFFSFYYPGSSFELKCILALEILFIIIIINILFLISKENKSNFDL